ncbi:MAG: hypothetical protein KAG53_05870 [Endozoicomonadaceae bacterium]|nr:hypothetical protein [Endozoicomonadaceae bacterium]
MNQINNNGFIDVSINRNDKFCQESAERRVSSKSNIHIIQRENENILETIDDNNSATLLSNTDFFITKKDNIHGVKSHRTVNQVSPKVLHTEIKKPNDSPQEKGTEPHKKTINTEKNGITIPASTANAFSSHPVESVTDEQDDIPESNVHSQKKNQEKAHKKESQQPSKLQIFGTAMCSFVLSLNPKFITPNKKKNSQEIPVLNFNINEKSTKTTNKKNLSRVCGYIELASKLSQSWLPIPVDMVQSLATSTTYLSAAQMMVNSQPKEMLKKAGRSLQQLARSACSILRTKKKQPKQQANDKQEKQQQPTNKTRGASCNESGDNGNDVSHANNGERRDIKERKLRNDGLNVGWVLKGCILTGLYRTGCSVYIPYHQMCPSEPIPVPDINTFERIGSSGCYPSDAMYQQTADINAANFSGTIQFDFSGHFDGGCHKITHLTQSLFNVIVGRGSVINVEFVNYNMTSKLNAGGMICNVMTDMAEIKDNHFGPGRVYSALGDNGIALCSGMAKKNSRITDNTGNGFFIDLKGIHKVFAFGAVIVQDDAVIMNNIVQNCKMIAQTSIGNLAIGSIYSSGNANVSGNVVRNCTMCLNGDGVMAVGVSHSSGNVTISGNIVQDSTMKLGNFGSIAVGAGFAEFIGKINNNMAIGTIMVIPSETAFFGVSIGILNNKHSESIGQSVMIDCHINSKVKRTILNVGSDQLTTKNVISAGNKVNGYWYSNNIERSSSNIDCANFDKQFVRETCYPEYRGAGIYSKGCGTYIEPIYNFGDVEPPVPNNSVTTSKPETFERTSNVTPLGGAPILESAVIGGGIIASVVGVVAGVVGSGYCIYHWRKGFNDGDRGTDLLLRPVTQTYNYFCRSRTNYEHENVPTTEPVEGHTESSV